MLRSAATMPYQDAKVRRLFQRAQRSKKSVAWPETSPPGARAAPCRAFGRAVETSRRNAERSALDCKSRASRTAPRVCSCPYSANRPMPPARGDHSGDDRIMSAPVPHSEPSMIGVRARRCDSGSSPQCDRQCAAPRDRRGGGQYIDLACRRSSRVESAGRNAQAGPRRRFSVTRTPLRGPAIRTHAETLIRSSCTSNRSGGLSAALGNTSGSSSRSARSARVDTRGADDLIARVSPSTI